MTKHLLFTVLFLLCTAKAATAMPASEPDADTLKAETAQHPDSIKKKKSFGRKILDYLNNSNKVDRNKAFDFSILGGPHYSTDTGLGLGLVGMGIYFQDKQDTISPPSDVAVFGDITTKQSYTLGVKGTHIFPYDKGRIEYTFGMNSFKARFWGIGYEMGNNDDAGVMKRLKISANASFMWEFADNMFFGPALTYDYVNAHEMDRPELLMGQDRLVWNIGAGVTFVYDSRDILTRPTKGVYINISQLFHPRFMSNGYAYTTTDFRFDTYGKLWKGAILAADIRGTLNFGNPSWGMMAQVGNSCSMRGYYGGRYRDKHKTEAQIELRQHIYKRHGVAVWGGAGTVFDKFSSVRFDRLLPNWGIGYRWEFKKNGNIRLDYGFGKNGISGFVFNINEAF